VNRSRRLGSLIGIAVLVTGAAACGGGSDDTGQVRATAVRGPMRVIATSADAAAAAKTARMSMSVDLATARERGRVAADGAFDFETRLGQMTMDTSALQLSGGRGRVEVRVLDGVVYVELGSVPGLPGRALERQLAGRHWLKIDASALPDQPGVAGFDTLGSSDPGAFLDSLRGVSSDVRELGHEAVRGVDTTRYAITVDMSKALEQAPPANRRAAKRGLETLGVDSIPADVWIDAHGRPRKFEMHLDAAAGGDTVAGTMTLELYDYGTKVDVQAPDPSDTVDMSALLDNALGGLGTSTSVTGAA
jgi:hypothetical protein